ncbi:MAG: PA14 domain-containing protein, partial [Pseudobdellovibrionaceae bacterium]|nr:PA14 domain-containing protein [Pseudobdellovibrionaceae bacterium]
AATSEGLDDNDDFNTIENLSIPGADEGSDLAVDVQETQLRFGSQTTSISTSLGGEKTNDVIYTVVAPAGKDPGKIVNGNTYVSPTTGTEAYEVKIIAVSKADPTQASSTTLKLEPATQVFVGCTNDMKGFPIKAEVYAIPDDTNRLPDFTSFAKQTVTACMDAFQIPNRAWSDGFPGQPKLIEWFALRATSHLNVTKSGKHYFKLNADDGAKLYIDGQLVVDNDGQHAQQAVTGSITLNAGDHEIVMEYFQGPRYHIALELFWKVPGTSTYTYVPASAFKP